MFRKSFGNYGQVYRHLWQTFGSTWQVRLSFILQFVGRIAKLVIHPIAISIIIGGLARGDYHTAKNGVLLFIVFSVLLGTLSPVVRYIGMLGENITYKTIMLNYFQKLVSADLGYFNSNLSGYLATAARQYGDSCLELIRALRAQYMNTLLSIIFPVAVIMYFDVILGGVTLALCIIQLAYLFWASRAINHYRAQTREIYKSNSGRMADIISNILIIKASSQEDSHVEAVKQGAQKESRIYTRRYTVQAKFIAAREFLTVIFFAVLLWLTVGRLSAGSISIEAAVLVITYTTTILAGIYSLQDDLDGHDDLIDRIIPAFDILNRRNFVQDPVQPRTLHNPKGAITFDSVSFGYEQQPNSEMVLKNLNLHIPSGQKVGIIGFSGAGKSTITKLLLRFNDVDSGSVRIDGIDVRSVTQHELRRNIAYVPQEPLLMHTSIRENVLLARPDATDDDIWDALRTAHAHTFVNSLPEGIQSIVGERGVKLSGGQKQRIAIARAVLQQTPIMVLDEATSALDSESEQIIKDSFAQILKGKTAIVVAHRLSTLSDMDRVIVINNGKLVEDGTHEELLKTNGLYTRLWSRQQRHLETP